MDGQFSSLACAMACTRLCTQDPKQCLCSCWLKLETPLSAQQTAKLSHQHVSGNNEATQKGGSYPALPATQMRLALTEEKSRRQLREQARDNHQDLSPHRQGHPLGGEGRNS